MASVVTTTRAVPKIYSLSDFENVNLLFWTISLFKILKVFGIYESYYTRIIDLVHFSSLEYLWFFVRGVLYMVLEHPCILSPWADP
jgi:hypothetical protein